MMIRSLRYVSAPFLLTLIAASGAPMTGCYVEPASPPPSQPQTVVSAPEPPAPPIAPPGPEIIVENPPPPPPAPPAPEPAPPAPPSPGNVWVAGNYQWGNGRYEWERGHYERPARPNARHVPGHWEARARGKAWVAAHWE
jgi:hypothetical protein